LRPLGSAGSRHLRGTGSRPPRRRLAADEARRIGRLHAALAADEEGARLWSRILDEYHRSIRLRRPYIDPLSHIQVRFLARLRSLPTDDPDRERFRRLVQLTVNGVPAGPQNTG
jgi:phosphoenolpyruvate carboxylase